ncbi:ubiquitin carboxyl-terminal hydrolase 29-like [Clupea harengus]|uniref:Ubiquitin carboxyl-terminal hydrolase 29-like n=1 Tax=Clupea harengus TaxID=7950 RepID=A0A8M1KH03_CLUHA|nr:ubiquitin carboxyl-terminal hydrolase 29-like [Clupea harengus]
MSSCGVESRREEISTYLSLQMVAQGTVQNSLELYFNESEVEYRCERCGGQVSSLRCSFYTLPQVLILHLKRFCPFTLTKSMAPLQLEAELQIKQRTEDIAGRCGESPQVLAPSAGSGRCPAATSTLGGASSSEGKSPLCSQWTLCHTRHTNELACVPVPQLAEPLLTTKPRLWV